MRLISKQIKYPDYMTPEVEITLSLDFVLLEQLKQMDKKEVAILFGRRMIDILFYEESI